MQKEEEEAERGAGSGEEEEEAAAVQPERGPGSEIGADGFSGDRTDDHRSQVQRRAHLCSWNGSKVC